MTINIYRQSKKQYCVAWKKTCKEAHTPREEAKASMHTKIHTHTRTHTHIYASGLKCKSVTEAGSKESPLTQE